MPNGLINYSQFCKNVDGASVSAANASKSTSKYSDNEQVQMTQIIQDIKNIVKAHRILLKPSFQDFDPANTQHITLQQFSRVLKQMQLMPSEPVFELLCKRYFDKCNTREINYFKFCHDVDRPEDMFPGQQLPTPPAAADGITDIITGNISRVTKSNFFDQSTKGINVLDNRFSQPVVNISNDPNDIEDRLRALVV